jgi:hypothetical protein
MLERIARWANNVRALFARSAKRIDMVGVVAILASITGGLIYLMAEAGPARCRNLPIRVIDLELTFSARRYGVLINWLADHGCKWVFLDTLISLDLIFPVAYAATLCSVFVWAERQRRFHPDGSAIKAELPYRNHIFVLIPLAAGAIDILLENLPLWTAGYLAASSGYRTRSWIATELVLVGSIAAFVKWSLVLVSVLTIIAELLHGARGTVVRRLRYGMLAVLLGALPLLIVPQGQDILQRSIEGDSVWPGILRAITAIMFGAYVVWYCSRKLVQLKFPRDGDAHREWYDFYSRQIPRILGTTVIVLVAAAFARAGAAFVPFALFAFGGFVAAALVNKFKPQVTRAIGRKLLPEHLRLMPKYDQDVGRVVIAIVASAGMFLWRTDAIDFQRLRAMSYILLTGAWLFYLYVYKRRGRIAASRARHAERSRASPGVDFTRYEMQRVEGEAVSSIDPRHLDRSIKAALVTGSILSLAALALFIWWAVPVARFVGALIVLSMFVATVVFYGSIATWVHERHGIPIAPIALVLAALFSVWNDSHIVRRVTGNQSSIAARPDIARRFAAWTTDSAGRRNGTVVLVAAAGGGLRAAYWTAMSLSALQDSISNFNRNVFAISSVSGGSVGASVYAALVRDSAASKGDVTCLRKHGSFQDCVHDFMEEDYLSPVLAKMVAPDFVQSFLPFPWSQLDRSLALEESWEASYLGVAGQPTMGRRFLSLYDSTSSPSTVPALFLNTTHVETGRRFIMSPLTRGDSAQPFGESVDNMHDSEDLLRLIGSDLRLSTAAHNSARFTYVSPPGRIQRSDTLEFGHVVDGGYFENSGLATLREIVDAIRERDPAARKVVLYLCNDPLPCNAESNRRRLPTMPRAAVVEWLGPLRAVMSTRGARGSLSRADIADLPDVTFLQLNVCDVLIAADTTDSEAFTLESSESEERARQRVISPPLGWLLSKVARDWMDASLNAHETRLRPSRCRMKNAKVVDSLAALLR